MLSVAELNVEFALPTGRVQALRDVSLDVSAGTILGIVGETGSGKSVTVRSIVGLLRPPGRVASGRVLFEGDDLLRLPDQRLRTIRGARISLVTQNPFGALNPVLTIAKQFRNLLRAHEKVTVQEADARTAQALHDVRIDGVERVMHGYAHQLSGGMAQRVVIAMALVLHPSLVIADEPTTALDLTTQRQILDLVRELIAGRDRSMILVTHDMGVVAQYCDAVAVMYAGRVLERGTVAAVLGDPHHPYTQALLESMPRPGHEITGIPGAAPSLAAMPAGCPFAPRCDAATEVCRSTMPEPTTVDGRTVACHHPRQGWRP